MHFRGVIPVITVIGYFVHPLNYSRKPNAYNYLLRLAALLVSKEVFEIYSKFAMNFKYYISLSRLPPWRKSIRLM